LLLALLHCNRRHSLATFQPLPPSGYLLLVTLTLLHLQGNKTGHVLAGSVVRTERELHKLMTVMAERYKDRQGGYTRIVQLGRRQHDAAPMAYIE
jgi:ribosomal protein L17